MIFMQELAGAAQFTGAAGAGLVDWSAATTTLQPLSPDNIDETIVIISLALETEELIPTIFIRYSQPGENIATTLQRVTILRPRVPNTITAQATAGFAFSGCAEFVPRNQLDPALGAASGRPWNLVLTTLGKTLAARWSVEYCVGVKPGKIPNR